MGLDNRIHKTLMDYEKIMKGLQELSTKRLVLRPFRGTDAADVFAYGKSYTATRYVTWVPFTHIAQAEKLLTDFFIPTVGTYAIELLETGRVIGCIDLRVNSKDAKAEIGFILNKHYWNQGFVTEAVLKILEVSFVHLGLNRVEACHFIDNPASGAVLKKSGFKKEGISQKHQIIKGSPVDMVFYGILFEDYFDKGINERI